MRVLIGVLLLSLSASQTYTRALEWRSDEALWRAGVRANPTLALPAYNLGSTLAHEGRWTEAADQFLVAAQHAKGGDLRRLAGIGLSYIDTVGEPICEQPRFSPWCVWVSP